MISYPFDYEKASSLDDALGLLADNPGARLLAGGHSLIPAMKLRLSSPSLLVDISGIDGMSGVTADGDSIRIGALTTHREVETSDVLASGCPVLAAAAGGIGDPQVRNRGTIGGSLAHADPSADYPALIVALGASMEITGPSGSRSVEADDFFSGMFETAIQPGEILTSITVPKMGAGMGAGYAKFANPASRYAVVGVAAMLSANGGQCNTARIAITGASEAVFRASAMEAALTGQSLDDASISAAAAAGTGDVEMLADVSANESYRAHLCKVMAARALSEAARAAS